MEGLYTGYSVFLPGGADPSTYLFNNGINAEHIWPQSMGADDEPARSDMHSLRPARANVNSARGNRPYGEIRDEEADAWYYLDQTRSTPPEENRDAWSEADNELDQFEPREAVKGEVARSLHYFYAIYQGVAEESFFLPQVPQLTLWHRDDPVDGAEAARAYRVSLYQGNVNPYLIDPTLVERAIPHTLPSTEGEVPAALARLGTPYPNPTRGAVQLPFTIEQTGPVRFAVYDLLGREVAVLVDEVLVPGDYDAVWAPSAPSGLYHLRLTSRASTASATVTVIR